MTNAELGIIGSIVTTPSCVSDAYNLVEPRMFSDELGRECYRVMLAMYDRNMEINIVQLCGELESSRIDKNDLMAMLKDATMSCQTSAYIKHYCEEVNKEYQARTIKELVSRVSLLPKDINNSMAEIATVIEHLMAKEEVQAKSLKQIVAENRANYFCEREDKGIRTGFYKLDELLGGLEGGDITVIGARPAVGKSAFVVQMIQQMASKGKKVGYFNLEMSDSQVYERMVSHTASMPLTRIRRAKQFLGDEEEVFNRASDVLSELPVTITSGSKTVSQIRHESKHMDYDIIVIDYLQLIKADRKYGNRASEVGDISKSIKGLAMELKIPIVLLSQLNRTSEGRETKEPSMAELRESGDIEQDASNIILLWNVSEDNNSFKGLKVDKNRQGEQGKIGLKFVGDNMRFEEQPETFEQFKSKVKSYEKSAEDLNNSCPFS